MGEEQRQFQRIPESFNIQCRPFGALSETWRGVVTMDLSAGGIRFRSEAWYELSDMLELQIQLPTSRVPLVFRGRVVRSRRLPSGNAECGIEFVDLTPDQQIELDELVQFLKKRASAP